MQKIQIHIRWEYAYIPLLLMLLNTVLFAQTAPDSVLSAAKIKTVKQYGLTREVKFDGGHVQYTIDGLPVSKRKYKKYNPYGACNLQPQWVQKYTIENQLFSEQLVNCGCNIGDYKEYYLTGPIRVTGQYVYGYRDNNRITHCNEPDGQWLYYNENGSVAYTEYWDKGKFIKQEPEQDSVEIWRLDFLMKGKPFGDTACSYTQLANLEVVPRYKNNNTTPIHVSFYFQCNACQTGKKYGQYKTSIDSITLTDWAAVIKNLGFVGTDTLTCFVSGINQSSVISGIKLDIAIDSLLPIEPPKSISQSWLTPQETFYLVNSVDTTKRVRIHHDYSIDIDYTVPSADTSIILQTATANGYLNFIQNDTVYFDAFRKDIEIEYSNGNMQYTTIEYNESGWDIEPERITFNKGDITGLSFTTKTREAIGGVGMAIGSVSLVATLLAAPLFSINYKTGEFNSKRYYIIAGAGLAGMTLGFPLASFANYNYYIIGNRNGSSGKAVWYLDSATN